VVEIFFQTKIKPYVKITVDHALSRPPKLASKTAWQDRLNNMIIGQTSATCGSPAWISTGIMPEWG
jgi:hypothetical protein